MPQQKKSTQSGTGALDTALPKPFHLLRYLILTCFLIILLTAILIQFIYRRTAVNTITDLGEKTNITLAQTALSSIRPQLIEFVTQREDITPEDAKKQALPPALDLEIQRLISETSIVRFKVYNRQGMVIFSTVFSQVGEVKIENPGVKAALGGKILSKMMFHGNFNPFDQSQDESNLIQSYLPALDKPFGQPLGVFEIYSDVNFLVHEIEDSQLLMLSMLGGVFLLMFVLIIASVWRAAAVITRQDQVIRERSQMLEFLTAKMLSDQESEKKIIAHGLHESVAQTLCGIKVRLESIVKDVDKSSPLIDSFTSLSGYLQDAIAETSSMAMHLRPSSLDDFGLIETLKQFNKDLKKSRPQLSIELLTEAEEEDISQSLKVIIFRIVQDTLNNIATQSEADKIKIILRSEKDSIELDLEENSRSYANASGTTGERINKAILPMRERTLLSGGDFSTIRRGLIRTHRSHWEF